MSLLCKWLWRLRSKGNSLWANCIKAIHNVNFVDGKTWARRSLKGVWTTIADILLDMAEKGVDLDSKFKRDIGRGDNTFFWKDRWCGDEALKDDYPQLYANEKNKNCRVMDRVSREEGSTALRLTWDWFRQLRRGREASQYDHLFSRLQAFKFRDGNDCWRWCGKGDGFSSQAVRKELVDAVMTSSESMVWVRWVPIKVNGFVWKLLQNRLPTRDNLVKRGIRIAEIVCPFCSTTEEDLDHVMFNCKFARELWSRVSSWCHLITGKAVSVTDLKQELKALKLDRNKLKLVLSVAYAKLWFLWKARNSFIFQKRKQVVGCILDDIVTWSFNWVRLRSKFINVDWVKWRLSPYVL